MSKRPSTAARLHAAYLSEPHAAAIGRVAAHWSYVDLGLDLIISTLLRLKGDTVYAVTTNLGSLQKVELVSTLLDLVNDASFAEKWTEIATNHEALRIYRNEAVHGLWIRRDETHNLFKTSSRGELKIKRTEVKTTIIEETGRQILALAETLISFNATLFNGGAAQVLADGPKKTARSPTSSLAAQAQDQARAIKKAKKQADRDRDRARSSKSS